MRYPWGMNILLKAWTVNLLSTLSTQLAMVWLWFLRQVSRKQKPDTRLTRARQHLHSLARIPLIPRLLCPVAWLPQIPVHTKLPSVRKVLLLLVFTVILLLSRVRTSRTTAATCRDPALFSIVAYLSGRTVGLSILVWMVLLTLRPMNVTRLVTWMTWFLGAVV